MERIRNLYIFGALRGSARVVCASAIAGALLLLGLARVSSASGPKGITIYDPDPNNPGVVAGVFDKCKSVHHYGHDIALLATTTNGQWDLRVTLNPFRGFRHRYIFRFGSDRPGNVSVAHGGQQFATDFQPPRGAHLITYIAGALQFHNGGATVSISADPNNNAYDAFARVDGTMRCIGRR
jgi:hypothetical protein